MKFHLKLGSGRCRRAEDGSAKLPPGWALTRSSRPGLNCYFNYTTGEIIYARPTQQLPAAGSSTQSSFGELVQVALSATRSTAAATNWVPGTHVVSSGSQAPQTEARSATSIRGVEALSQRAIPLTRTPSTHGLFDIHFSSNIFFEVIKPHPVGSLTIIRASIKCV